MSIIRDYKSILRKHCRENDLLEETHRVKRQAHEKTPMHCFIRSMTGPDHLVELTAAIVAQGSGATPVEQKAIREAFRCLALESKWAWTEGEETPPFGRCHTALSFALSPRWKELIDNTHLEIPHILELAKRIEYRCTAPSTAEQKFYQLLQTLKSRRCKFSGLLPITFQDWVALEKQLNDNALCAFVFKDWQIPGCNLQTCGIRCHDTNEQKAAKIRTWLQENVETLRQQEELILRECSPAPSLGVLPSEIYQYFSHIQCFDFHDYSSGFFNLKLLENLKKLRIEARPLMVDFDLGGLPRGLESFSLYGADLKEVDLSKLPPSLRHLELIRCQLERFDLTQLPRGLETIDLSQNLLKSVDLTQLPTTLRSIKLAGNRLKEVDLSQLPAGLEFIGLYHNQLNAIDRSQLPDGLEVEN